MLPGNEQTCPDFELRWCCPKNLSDEKLPYNMSYTNYTIDDLPKTSNLRYYGVKIIFHQMRYSVM